MTTQTAPEIRKLNDEELDRVAAGINDVYGGPGSHPGFQGFVAGLAIGAALEMAAVAVIDWIRSL